jgi:hypothetical protein
MPLTRTRTHDYEPPREAAMAAFAKSWRRELVLRSGSPLSGQTGKHLVPLSFTGSDGHSAAFTRLPYRP